MRRCRATRSSSRKILVVGCRTGEWSALELRIRRKSRGPPLPEPGALALQAVAAFLEENIGFGDIPRIVEATLERVSVVEPDSMAVVESADSEARVLAAEIINGYRRSLRAQGEV